MSQSNAERLYAGFEAFNRGDYRAATEGIHEDFEWHRPNASLETGAIRGIEGFRQMMLPEVFDRQHAQLETLAESEDRMLIGIHFRVRGKSSGIEIENVAYQVWTFRDQLAYRCYNFETLEQARAAFEGAS